MEISGYSTLKQLVSDVLIDKYGQIDSGRYFQIMRWAVRKYVDLKIHVLPQNKPVKLTVQQDPYCVKLPNDYVNFRAIGIDINGRFRAFDPDTGMAAFVDEECGQETQGTNEVQDVLPYPVWYTYQLDEQNQRILLQGYPYLDEVILLYVSTGVEVGGDTVIPAKVYEVLLSWLHYQLAKHSGGTQVEMAEAWATHQREMNKFIKTKWNLDEMYLVLFDVANKKS